jgi:hypothetical protein
MDHYESETEIENVVRGFESCETGADDFNHRDHLVVALWYLKSMDKQAALERMRNGLLRFLNHYEGNTSKYSEEITVFWIDWLAERLSEANLQTSFLEKCNNIISSANFKPQINTDSQSDQR